MKYYLSTLHRHKMDGTVPENNPNKIHTKKCYMHPSIKYHIWYWLRNCEMIQCILAAQELTQKGEVWFVWVGLKIKCQLSSFYLASQITSLSIVFTSIYLGGDQRKHQSSASMAFVCAIHRWPVNFPHKWPETRKIFPFDNVIIIFHVRKYQSLLRWDIKAPWHKGTSKINSKGHMFWCRSLCVIPSDVIKDQRKMLCICDNNIIYSYIYI